MGADILRTLVKYIPSICPRTDVLNFTPNSTALGSFTVMFTGVVPAGNRLAVPVAVTVNETVAEAVPSWPLLIA